MHTNATSDGGGGVLKFKREKVYVLNPSSPPENNPLYAPDHYYLKLTLLKKRTTKM